MQSQGRLPEYTHHISRVKQSWRVKVQDVGPIDGPIDVKERTWPVEMLELIPEQVDSASEGEKGNED